MEVEEATFRFMEHTEMGCPVEGCGSVLGDVVEIRVKHEGEISHHSLRLRCKEGHRWALVVTIHDGVMMFGVIDLRPEADEE